MKNFKLFLLFSLLCLNYLKAQDNQIPRSSNMPDISRGQKTTGSILDSVPGFNNNQSTILNKNPDAKIQDYLIITRANDTIAVDTSLTIEKYHKINFLRKDDFDLIPFSNTGVAYNTLSFYGINSINPKMGASNKYYSYDSVDDVVYYDLPTPFTELMSSVYRYALNSSTSLFRKYRCEPSRLPMNLSKSWEENPSFISKDT